MSKITIGIMGTSLRENEFRVPLHPHFLLENGVPATPLKQLVFEEGYGLRWNISDDQLKEHGVSIATKGEIYNDMDAVMIAKPMIEDLYNLKHGGVLIGWLHFTLYGRLASVAVERKQTVLTFEGLNTEMPDGRWENAFPENSRIAGIGGLHHLMATEGIHPEFSKRQNVTIIGFGIAGRGIAEEAVRLGFQNVTCLTLRDPDTIEDRPDGVQFLQYMRSPSRPDQSAVVSTPDDGVVPMAKFLRGRDLIFHCSGQDPKRPLQFVALDELQTLNHPCFIVDISCDPGMGFMFSRTTTFEKPSYRVGDMVVYSVDHIPGYFYDGGSWVYTKAVSQWITDFCKGPDHWMSHQTMRPAVEVLEGAIRKTGIISYQERDPEPPYYCKDPQKWRVNVDKNRVDVRNALPGHVVEI